MKKAQEWIKCPRCELNYILKKDKYCDVCKQEMKAGSLSMEDDMLGDELGEEEEMILCPICKINYISPNETACKSCLEEGLVNEDMDAEDWRAYMDKTDAGEDDDLDLLPTDDDDMPDDMGETFADDLDEDYDDEDLDEDSEYKDDFDEVDIDDEEFDDEDLDEDDEDDFDDDDED